MWIPAPVVQELDRSGTRPELAREATQYARQALPGTDVEIFWDELWIRRIGSHYFPDPEMWQTPDQKVAMWPDKAQKYLRDVDDYWFHLYKPAAGDSIVDIGAGRGEDVFGFARAVGSSGHVWAIEPHPTSFAVLKKFCALNGITNVTAIQAACVDTPSGMHIETLPVWESNFVRSGEPSATSHPVRGVRFDDLAAELGIRTISFLKMNIEGAERFALPGCKEALSRTRYATIAAHDFRAARGEGESFRTLGFVRGFLEDAGFELVTRDNDPRYYVPYHVHGHRKAVAP